MEILHMIILSCQINVSGHGYTGQPTLIASEIMDIQMSKQKACVKELVNCFKGDKEYEQPLSSLKVVECFGK